VFTAIAPLLEIVGGEVIAPEEMTTGDIPIEWEGRTIGAVRLGSLSGALERMVDHIESELGASLSDLGRTDKQAAIRMLDEQGAFLLRKSIDEVADRMGVSRITVYNYLTHVRGS
jgi:DNA invertase Pin-like site-specific DNA recombinase